MTPLDSCAFLFPGQGSQAIGMGKALCEAFPLARDTFAQADEVLGYPLSQVAWEGPADSLNDTVHTQPALFVHSVAAWRVLQQTHPEIQPLFVAGHSLGELSALVASQALPFADALQLVRKRGELMKMAGEIAPGGMAAILGLDIPTLEGICARASTPTEGVQVANDNCPGQVVISGTQPAIERALAMAHAAGARRAVPLAVSIAAHSSLMQPAQNEFNHAVTAAPLVAPRIPLIGNVTARPLTTAADIRADLQAQLNSRVRWTEAIQYMIARGVATFWELGSGSVLTGLLKRINPQVASLPLGTLENFQNIP